MIAPCLCKGSMEWVHRRCLDRWRVSATDPRIFTNCRQCDFKFRLVLKRSLTESEDMMRKRKHRFIFQVVSNAVLMALAVQVLLCLVALAIRGIDREEKLVELFHFPQVEESPPAGQGDFWQALRYHKSTYYCAAVLLTLFLTGICKGFAACLKGCGCSCSNCNQVVPPSDPLNNYLISVGCRDCCQCCGDCCTMCSECDCPACDCRCPNTPGTCGGCNCDTCDCNDCKCDGDAGKTFGAFLIVAIVVIVVAFIFVGLVVVFMAIVAWAQKVMQRYMQLFELRQLTGEYVVEDLSHTSLHCKGHPPLPQNMVPSAPPPEPSAPPSQNMDDSPLVTDPETEQRLLRDLQAVYGYVDAIPRSQA